MIHIFNQIIFTTVNNFAKFLDLYKSVLRLLTPLRNLLTLPILADLSNSPKIQDRKRFQAYCAGQRNVGTWAKTAMATTFGQPLSFSHSCFVRCFTGQQEKLVPKDGKNGRSGLERPLRLSNCDVWPFEPAQAHQPQKAST